VRAGNLGSKVVAPRLWKTELLMSGSSDFQEIEEIAGAGVFTKKLFRDDRGVLGKVFAESAFRSSGTRHHVSEVFWSQSRRDVLRGMHYQEGQDGQSKTVTVLLGEICDVLFDVRRASPTFGRHFSTILCEIDSRTISIPPGVAHGFKVLSETAITLYSVSTEYDPGLERGINSQTIGFEWPGGESIISERDLLLPPFSPAESNLLYEGQQ